MWILMVLAVLLFIWMYGFVKVFRKSRSS